MSLRVPTFFYYNNQLVEGVLKSVSGAGNIYHLMVNDYYRGQLNYSEHFGWQFSSNTSDLEHLSEFFGEQVAIALDSVS
jgi:hypothetical protein